MNNYILTFEKISDEHLVAGVGTSGNIWIVLGALLNIDYENKYTFFVDMEKNITINSENELINGTSNPWEYYFKQTERPLNDFIPLHSVKRVSEKYRTYSKNSA